MKTACLILFCFLLSSNQLIIKFSTQSDLSSWRIIDDVVMGGQSNGDFIINKDGYGEFYGTISLKNNGGFSSVRYALSSLDTKVYTKFVLRIKGDGKPFQFRVKDTRYNRHSYCYKFKTSGEWETIEIPFSEMYPSFRGYRLGIPNFQGNSVEEIAFLFGEKKEESFKLLIDSIHLK